MNHVGKVLWIPANKEYSVVCKVCGITLLDGVINTIDGLEFDFDGDCEGPDDALGIEVEDGVGTDDIFGGVD